MKNRIPITLPCRIPCPQVYSLTLPNENNAAMTCYKSMVVELDFCTEASLGDAMQRKQWWVRLGNKGIWTNLGQWQRAASTRIIFWSVRKFSSEWELIANIAQNLMKGSTTQAKFQGQMACSTSELKWRHIHPPLPTLPHPPFPLLCANAQNIISIFCCFFFYFAVISASPQSVIF